MIIYDKEGVVLLDIEVDDTSVRYKAIKGENSLTLKFSLPEHVEVPLGAYCEFKGETYTLMMPEDLTMNHRRSFEYSLVMHSEDAKAKRFMFINPVDGRLKFSLTAKPVEHLQMFCDNMNKREGGNAWKVGECVDHVEIVLSYNHTYCYDALVQLANELEEDYWFDGKTVNLGKLEVNKDEPLPLSYGGDGLGLKSNIKRTNYADALPMEILYVQGGSANIDPSKYRVPDGSAIGSSVLLLPSSKTIGYDGVRFEGEDGFDVSKARYYVTDSEGYSVRRADKEIQNYAEDSLDCSEIKPTREETVESVIESDKEKHFYDLVFKSDVDYKQYGIEGEIATIVFQSGMLAGKEFDLATDTNGNLICANAAGGHWRVEIVPQDIDGITMPDEASRYLPVKGDTFKVFGVQLPNEYVSEAEMEMLRYAVKHLYANEDAQYTISGELDEIYAKRNWDAIRNKIVLGGYVSFSDKSFQEEPLLIRITGIKEYVNKPYSPMLEISNAAVAGSLIGSITRLENDEVKNEQMYRDAVRYSKRRFSSALDTIEMLKGAFKDFSEGVNPVTVQTMAMLIGDESLQFKFTSLVGTNATKPAISYDADSKRLLVSRSYRIWHMTLGIDSVTAPSGRSDDDYLKWTMSTWNSGVLDDGSKGYYLYARVPKDGTDGTYLLSENTIAMESEEGYYQLLVGVLNKEYEGTRDFVPLYGFTEVLPGQITTDVIRSADGNSVLDLVSGLLTFGAMVGLSGQTAAEGENLRIWAGKGEAERDDAPFRVYDDGSVFASLMTLLKGCKIGKLTITEDGILVNTTSGGRISINQYGVRAVQKDGSSAELGVCGSQAVMILGKDAGGQCYIDEDTYKIGAQINAANGYHAVHSLSGVYAGLRPNIREVKSSAALDVLDHTIILSNSTGMTLTLPTYPQTGQTYKLIHTSDMRVDLACAENDLIIDAATAATVVSSFNERTTLTLTYFEGVWYAEFK